MHFLWSNKALCELDQIRTILVSHLGILERKLEEEKRRRREEEEKKKRKKRRKVWKPCFCMETRILYGSVCMEISSSISRV